MPDFSVSPDTKQNKYALFYNCMHFFNISQKVLTDSLRQMMDDGLAYRKDYQELPPRVEYGLTDLGREMLPIIDALADFGKYYQSIVS